MPASTKKRKVDPTLWNSDAELSQLEKRSIAIKSAEGSRSMELFLSKICSHEREIDLAKIKGITEIQQSSMLVNAMLRCHERFVRIVAIELAAATSAAHDKNENFKAVCRIGEHHVQQALKELGMEDIYLKMKQCQAEGRAANVEAVADATIKRKRRTKSSAKQWTEEEILEQESLLASSKEKLQLVRGDD